MVFPVGEGKKAPKEILHKITYKETEQRRLAHVAIHFLMENFCCPRREWRNYPYLELVSRENWFEKSETYPISWAMTSRLDFFLVMSYKGI